MSSHWCEKQRRVLHLQLRVMTSLGIDSAKSHFDRLKADIFETISIFWTLAFGCEHLSEAVIFVFGFMLHLPSPSPSLLCFLGG